MHTENNSIMAHFCRDTTLPKTVADLISRRLTGPVSTAEAYWTYRCVANIWKSCHYHC